jgi:hypothetical protein
VEKIAWAGHSPDVNASEHTWPILRRHVTRDFPLSHTEQEVEAQWTQAWKDLSVDKINKWVDGVAEVVRRIIRNKGNNNFHG